MNTEQIPMMLLDRFVFDVLFISNVCLLGVRKLKPSHRVQYFPNNVTVLVGSGVYVCVYVCADSSLDWARVKMGYFGNDFPEGHTVYAVTTPRTTTGATTRSTTM